jgi:hypothetical protein
LTVRAKIECRLRKRGSGSSGSSDATERFGRKGDGALVEKVEDERVGVGGLGIRCRLYALDVFQLRHFVHLFQTDVERQRWEAVK